MLESSTYLCGVCTNPYTSLYEVSGYSPDNAAEEYCLMYEGGWEQDHFNLSDDEPRTIQVLLASDQRANNVHYFEVVLAEDSDSEYVVTEVAGWHLPFPVSRPEAFVKVIFDGIPDSMLIEEQIGYPEDEPKSFVKVVFDNGV